MYMRRAASYRTPFVRTHNTLVLYRFVTTLLTVAMRSEALVCDVSLTWIAGSNPGGGIDVACERCVSSGRCL
jgi:hypothetical protein